MIPERWELASEPAGTSELATVSVRCHALRIGMVVLFAGLLLGWLAWSAEIFFADGLRYIAQARALGRGAKVEGLEKAVDHPAYPAAIAAVHRVVSRGDDSPESWQASAQGASILAGLLLVVPLYLLTREWFGDRAALPGTLLFFALPVTGHVFADTLSESTFLLFWAWGLWGACRFLRVGSVPGLVLAALGSGLAYLTRPEGLLLPAALTVALVLHARWWLGRLGRRGAVLVVGSLVIVAGIVGPYVVLKGGLSSKPSIARLLGRAPRSAAQAVERQRPLDPEQSEGKTYALAAKAVGKAIGGALTFPLAALAGVGLLGVRPREGSARVWTFLAVIGLAAVLALGRLHVTGGYCTPRHAMVLTLVLAPAAAAGLETVLRIVLDPLRRPAWLPFVRVAAVMGLLALLAPESLARLNAGLGGYKEAGRWLASEAASDGRVVDVTGWALYYGRLEAGYTFRNLNEAPSDPNVRWVVARDAHLAGPWWYCQRLRELVKDREPVRVFRSAARRGASRVLVYDLAPQLAVRELTGDTPR